MANRINTFLVKEYKELFEKAGDLITVTYPKMSVQNINALRNHLAEQGITLLVVKNRLVDIAFKELGRSSVIDICDGQTAFVSGAEDPVGLARILVDWRKEHKELTICGGLVEETLLDNAAVIALSKSPNKEELKGIIAGQALSPGASIAGAAIGPGGMIVGAIKGLIEKLEEGGEGSEAAEGAEGGEESVAETSGESAE